MEILSNKDLKECTKYISSQLMRVIGMMEMMLAINEDIKTVEYLKILRAKLITLHNDTHTLEKKLDI